jgi:hypothetical protein
MNLRITLSDGESHDINGVHLLTQLSFLENSVPEESNT